MARTRERIAEKRKKKGKGGIVRAGAPRVEPAPYREPTASIQPISTGLPGVMPPISVLPVQEPYDPRSWGQTNPTKWSNQRDFGGSDSPGFSTLPSSDSPGFIHPDYNKDLIRSADMTTDPGTGQQISRDAYARKYGDPQQTNTEPRGMKYGINLRDGKSWGSLSPEMQSGMGVNGERMWNMFNSDRSRERMNRMDMQRRWEAGHAPGAVPPAAPYRTGFGQSLGQANQGRSYPRFAMQNRIY